MYTSCMRLVRNPLVSEIPVVLAMGSFDGLHLGHQALLDEAKALARKTGVPSAVLTFEPLPREFFNKDEAPPRLMSLHERLQGFQSLGLERVFLCRFDEHIASLAPSDFLGYLKENLLVQGFVAGDDFRFGANRLGDIAFLRNFSQRKHLDLVTVPQVCLFGSRVSSTAIRKALSQGDLRLARLFLGRPYGVSARVEKGDGRGREIGYATANLGIGGRRLPLSGVFAVTANLEEKRYWGMANIGVRPTIEDSQKTRLEAHFFGWEGDLYGKRILVQFWKKLRDEQKFSSVAALAAQIRQDEKAAKEALYHIAKEEKWTIEAL